MDGVRFDTLTRRLAAGTSRRGILTAALAGLLGALTDRDADAQRPPRQPNGASCIRAKDCTSFRCVDGVCCNTSCSGQCEACNLPGREGLCSPVSGAPVGKRPACPGTGPCQATCDGSTRTRCAAFPAGETLCGKGFCVDGFRTTYACSGNGTCHPTTTRCGAGEICCDGACVDASTDPTNCGGCGVTCASDEACSAGVCGHCGFVFEPCCPPDNACEGSLRFCDESGTCQPCGLQFAPCCPPDNTCLEDFTFCDAASGTCQGCGNTGEPCCLPDDSCASDLTCDAATGTCGQDQVCGDIGEPCCPAPKSCGDGQACCTGQCVDVSTDPTNCGDCRVVCASEACSAGACLACGIADQPCCPPDDRCGDLSVCDAASGTCRACGRINDPCCPPDNFCVLGTCVGGICSV